MKDFTLGHIAKNIFFFAVPMILGNVFMQLYQFADTVIVGRLIGKKALAAVGSCTPVVFLTVALVAGIGIGASIVISQYFGAKQFGNVRTTCDTLFLFLIVASVVTSVIGISMSGYILKWIGLPDDVLPFAKSYLQIYFCGLILLFGYNAVAAILRGVGDSKTPLYFLILSSVLNIILDLVFIKNFGWGIEGAAWATVLAQGFAFILCVIYVNRTNPVIRVELIRPKFSRSIFMQCIKLGLPAGLQQTFVAIGMLALIGIVTKFGTDIIAAYVSVNRIDTFAALPVMNFSAALTTFVGQNMGPGNTERIRQGLRSTLMMAVGTCIVVNLLIIIFGRALLSLFSTDPMVIDAGYKLLVIINSFYPVFAVMFVINGLLRGAGAAIIPMLITLLSLWLVRLPSAMVLSNFFGYEGLWWSYPTGWFVGLICALAYYFSGKWKNKGIINTK
ncbi:MAG: MATE family efflux transporter [Rikenellaceae bacterium]|nr:MATE family efflux transporter [Rikenellaceae bacterium]